MHFVEGQVYPFKLRKNGESYYLLLSPDILEYVGITNPDEELVVLVAEKSKRWGNYFGLGKDKR